MKGKIISINISQRKGTSKKPVGEASLKKNCGIPKDAHAGKWHRQLSLLSWESVKKFAARKGASMRFRAGDFAENITVDVDLSFLKVGDCIKLGKEGMIRVTQIGKKCHKGCVIYQQLGECLMPKEGIFAEVLKEGQIQVGDEIEVLNDKNRNNYR